MDIAGRVAVVTGAAAGIGRATALALADAGVAAVAVVDVDGTGGRETVDLVTERGAAASFHEVDVSSPEQLAALFTAVEATHGGLDLLHNNAGIMAGSPAWPESDPGRLALQVAVNLGAVVLGTRLAVEPMVRRGGGAVVNTASIAGLGPLPPDACYSATKAGVIMFTQSCAPMRESHGIRVNAVCPGMVDTPIIGKTGDGVTPADWLAPHLASRPLLRPEEIADAVVSLFRDDSMAGQYVVVDRT